MWNFFYDDDAKPQFYAALAWCTAYYHSQILGEKACRDVVTLGYHYVKKDVYMT